MSKKKRTILFYDFVFIAPSILFFGLIIITPFLQGMFYSFTKWDGVNTPTWNGWANFIRMFSDRHFINSFWFTVKITVVIPIISNLLALFLASMLVLPLKTKAFMRASFFIPNVVSGVLLGFVWNFIFTNIFNSIGEKIGGPFFSLPWLATPDTGFWAIVIVSVWSFSGYLMVIYIAAMVGVPKMLYEAAYIDGANPWQTFKSITLPMIMPATTVCIFLSVVTTVRAFDIVLSLTNGGPFSSTTPIALDIYEEAFGRERFGRASAKAAVFFIIVGAITVTQILFTKRKEVEV